MLVADIIALVKDAIEDESFTNDKILSYVNKGVGRVAAALPLPMLTVEGVITCKGNSRVVTLPDAYYSNLFWAYNSTKAQKVEITQPLTNFLMRHPGLDSKGDVCEICVQGRKLYYQGIPASDQLLSVFYTSRPEELSAGDSIEVIEEVYQADLLVSYAAAECYKLIENGIEGTKVNYNKWIADYTLAIKEYGDFIGLAQETPDFVPEGEGGASCPSI